MKTTIEGTDGEEGAVSKWVGDPKLTGEGEMTNTGIKDSEEITYHLHFIKPWESESDGYIRLADAEGGTKVSWGFYGKNPFPWNIMMLFMNMDKMIGKDFERGLEKLKELAEKEAAEVEKYEVKKVKFLAKNYAAVQKEVSWNEMKDFFESSFKKLQETMKQKRARMTGAPAGLYFTWDEQNMKTDMAVAIPSHRMIDTEDVKTVRLPTSEAYSVDHVGPYEGLYYAHRALGYYLNKNGIKMKAPAVEEYLTDPTAEPDTSKWLTKIYYFAE